MDDFDDGELLQLIADREPDEESAKKAYSVFWFRHLPWLIKEANKRIFRIPGRDAEGFARDLLTSVYESKAAKFPDNRFASRLDAERAVRAWLGQIAERQLIDCYRVRGGTTEDDNFEQLFNPPTADNESAPGDILSVTPESPRPEVSIAKRMLEELCDRNRVIVHTYLTYEEKGKRLPPDILQGLADEFNTSSDNVRKIYFRFREKVRKAIEDIQ